MKIIIKFITFVLIFSSMPFAKADVKYNIWKEWGEELWLKVNNNHEKRIEGLNTRLEEHLKISNNNFETIDSSFQNLMKRDEELEQEIRSLSEKLDQVVDALKKANIKAEKGDRKGSYSLWLLLPISVFALAVVCFAFWPRKLLAAPSSSDSSSQLKCPRCGWEHGPNDSVCKNPACKTQF